MTTEKMKMKSNIKKIMLDKDISIPELSNRTGLMYQNAYRMVNKEYLDSVQLFTLINISDALGVDIDDLYTEIHICN